MNYDIDFVYLLSVKAGFTISGKDHPISPVMLGDARLAAVMADDMLQRGIYVIGFSFPVVPRGQARIRVQLSGNDCVFILFCVH